MPRAALQASGSADALALAREARAGGPLVIVAASAQDRQRLAALRPTWISKHPKACSPRSRAPLRIGGTATQHAWSKAHHGWRGLG